MKKQKNLVKLADCILSALLDLKKARLKEIQTKLEEIGYRSSEAIKYISQNLLILCYQY